MGVCAGGVSARTHAARGRLPQGCTTDTQKWKEWKECHSHHIAALMEKFVQGETCQAYMSCQSAETSPLAC